MPASGDRGIDPAPLGAQYGGMKANNAKRLKELEAENALRKKLVATQALDMLREIGSGNF